MLPWRPGKSGFLIKVIQPILEQPTDGFPVVVRLRYLRRLKLERLRDPELPTLPQPSPAFCVLIQSGIRDLPGPDYAASPVPIR